MIEDATRIAMMLACVMALLALVWVCVRVAAEGNRIGLAILLFLGFSIPIAVCVSVLVDDHYRAVYCRSHQVECSKKG
jgi:hypothetical protein